MKFVVRTAFGAGGKEYAVGDVVTREKMGPNLDIAVHRGLVAVFESRETEFDPLEGFIRAFEEFGKGSE